MCSMRYYANNDIEPSQKSIKADIRSIGTVVQRTDNVARDSRRVVYETKHVANIIDSTTQNTNTVTYDTNATLHSLQHKIKSDLEIREERISCKRTISQMSTPIKLMFYNSGDAREYFGMAISRCI